MKIYAPALSIFLVICCLSVAFVGTACGANKRTQTLVTALTAVNVARDTFVAWDGEHEKALVERATSRADAEAALAGYLAKRKPVADTFEVVYRTIALAATQADEASLQAAIVASGKLIDAIKALRDDVH